MNSPLMALLYEAEEASYALRFAANKIEFDGAESQIAKGLRKRAASLDKAIRALAEVVPRNDHEADDRLA